MGLSKATPLVTIRDLTVVFKGVVVLHGIDLHVAPGECLGLVGEPICASVFA